MIFNKFSQFSQLLRGGRKRFDILTLGLKGTKKNSCKLISPKFWGHSKKAKKRLFNNRNESRGLQRHFNTQVYIQINTLQINIAYYILFIARPSTLCRMFLNYIVILILILFVMKIAGSTSEGKRVMKLSYQEQTMTISLNNPFGALWSL